MNILALFDDGSRSYYNALKDKHNVISVGIQNKVNEDNFIQLDLSKGEESYNSLKELCDKYKIDLILASPPCDSFSSATLCKSKLGNIGTAFQKVDSWSMWDIDEWVTLSYSNISRHVDKWSTEKINAKYNQYKDKGELGRDIVKTLQLSLERLKIPFLIENPRNSYMWRYMGHIGFTGYYKNTTCYNDYDEDFIQKPTTFYGTYKLDLKCTYTKAKKSFSQTKKSKKGENDGGARADIPKKLILDIVKQIECINNNHVNME